MTLREKCEKATNEILDLDLSRPRGEEIADAIERVARAFAERALRAMVPNFSERYFNHGDYEIDGTYREAIAAAERGE